MGGRGCHTCSSGVHSATQWDLVHGAAKKVMPAFEELIRQAAQGELLHNDDTTMKVLEPTGSSCEGPAGRGGRRAHRGVHVRHRRNR